MNFNRKESIMQQIPIDYVYMVFSATHATFLFQTLDEHSHKGTRAQ